MLDSLVVFWHGTVAWNWTYLSVTLADWWYS